MEAGRIVEQGTHDELLAARRRLPPACTGPQFTAALQPDPQPDAQPGPELQPDPEPAPLKGRPGDGETAGGEGGRSTGSGPGWGSAGRQQVGPRAATTAPISPRASSAGIGSSARPSRSRSDTAPVGRLAGPTPRGTAPGGGPRRGSGRPASRPRHLDPQPAAASPAGRGRRRPGLPVADRQHHQLHRGVPGRERALVHLDQVREQPLHAADQAAVHHHRAPPLAVGGRCTTGRTAPACRSRAGWWRGSTRGRRRRVPGCRSSDRRRRPPRAPRRTPPRRARRAAAPRPAPTGVVADVLLARPAQRQPEPGRPDAERGVRLADQLAGSRRPPRRPAPGRRSCARR